MWGKTSVSSNFWKRWLKVEHMYWKQDLVKLCWQASVLRVWLLGRCSKSDSFSGALGWLETLLKEIVQNEMQVTFSEYWMSSAGYQVGGGTLNMGSDHEMKKTTSQVIPSSLLSGVPVGVHWTVFSVLLAVSPFWLLPSYRFPCVCFLKGSVAVLSCQFGYFLLVLLTTSWALQSDLILHQIQYSLP